LKISRTDAQCEALFFVFVLIGLLRVVVFIIRNDEQPFVKAYGAFGTRGG
jgi:hypothetical protein